ncbi:MAG: NnrU family protein [Aestuariivirga sp.]
MTYLFSGIVLFGGIHLFSMLLPGQRDALKARFGEKTWKGLYALVSLVGLGLMVRGFMLARSGPLAADWLYVPAGGTRHVTMLLVLLGFISIGASHGKGYLKLGLRNPMSIGIGLWAFGHLLANGKRTDVYFFGTFLVLALLDIVLSTLRGKKPAHEPHPRSDIIAVIVGMVLYVIFLFGFHPYVLNLPVVG